MQTFLYVLVSISTRELRKNSVFNPIRDAVIRLAINRFGGIHEDAMDDEVLSIFRDCHSDDENESENILQVDDKQTARIFDPEFVLEGYNFGPMELDVLTERLSSSLRDHTLKYEMFDANSLCAQFPLTSMEVR